MVSPILALQILGEHTPYCFYLLERIKDEGGYRKGERIWALAPCKGWRVVRKRLA